MMKLNTPPAPIFTHEGAKAQRISAEQQLRRSVMACLLWEGEFYEDGEAIARRICETVPKVSPEAVRSIAVAARGEHNLRHVPLLLASACCMRHANSGVCAGLVADVIQRADELAEIVAIHCKLNGVGPDKAKKVLGNSMKRGLARAFTKFDAYQLGKYDKPGAIRLRDVLFMCHAKPKDREQAAVWRRLVDGKLESPDTWEVSLSGGADKKATFERLLRDGKLGYLALLRNLRNMIEAGVDRNLVAAAIARRAGAQRVLPFRFVAAAKHAPSYEPELDASMLAGLSQSGQLPGKTVVIIDVSGSMYRVLVSSKSDMGRATAACALGAICREVCEDARIYATAGNDMMRVHDTAEVPPRRGMALVDAIYGMCQPLGGGGIFLKQVMDFVISKEHTADRVICITDEQDCDVDGSPSSARLFSGARHYMLNVASCANGIAYDKWTHINGFSESVIRYILEAERNV
jgi:60 kDa SS-A/Ro ribonucleoprotein